MSTAVEARIREDLDASGLTIEDMRVRVMDNAEKASCHVAHSQIGYVIPYFDIQGRSQPFYRVKVFDSEPKYKQPKESPSYVYFPRGFYEVASKTDYIIITEGEKKAALAVKRGYPAVGLGGVDSWRNRNFQIPKEAELNATDKTIRAKLPSGTEVKEDFMSPLALGMQDLIDYAISTGKTLFIIYDTDIKNETSFNVQRAAAALGYELRFRGVPYSKIRQIRLPLEEGDEKMALDDFLMGNKSGALDTLIQASKAKRSAFPRHPNVRDYINKRLQNAKMSRKEMQQVAMTVLCELDANGMRLRSSTELQTYYFDFQTHKLLKATFTDNPNQLTDSPFGHFLYRNFGLGAADARLIQWLGTQFTGEDPVEEVNPFRVFARPQVNADKVMLQISDGQYVEVGPSDPVGKSDLPGYHVRNNGENGVLFEAEQVKALDVDKLTAQYRLLAKRDMPECWWADVLSQVRLKDKNKARMLAAFLFYISPWLYRWRGTQLPIEMTLGEAGSGKSTLQELRLNVITGIPKLRNAPQDMKDWSASVASTGGLHIIDNLQLPDRNMRQRISDEICRVITEPEPTIEMRKYYTNADLISLPVRCVFGITAIKQPFLNSDVLARAIIIELDKSLDLVNGRLNYDSQWMATQLQRYGGREAWVAHHLDVLRRFFDLVRQKWNMKYQARHRLINMEQALVLMANVFGMDGSWIPDYLQGVVNVAVLDSDWAFEGLTNFVAQRRENKALAQTKFGAQEISNWAMSMEEYEKCEELVNSRRIGRYLTSHKALLASALGLVEAGSQNNRKLYFLEPNK